MTTIDRCWSLVLYFGVLVGAGLIPLPASAQAPTWWTNRAIVESAIPNNNDFIPLNQGQLKWLAKQATLEFSNSVPRFAVSGSNILSLVAGFSPTNGNYSSVNLGQLKTVAQPFYDFLWLQGLTNVYPRNSAVPYPWPNVSQPVNDFALVNVGQAKYLFSFDGEALKNGDFDLDGMSDAWELASFGDLNQTGSGDPDQDGLNNLEEFLAGTSPVNADTDGDGLSDGMEVKPFVVYWSKDGKDVICSNLLDSVALVADDAYGYSIMRDGRVIDVVNNSCIRSGATNILKVVSSDQCCFAIQSNGHVIAWGAWFDPLITNLTNIIDISASVNANSWGWHCLALQGDGHVVAWGGDNGYGQATLPYSFSNAVAVSAMDETLSVVALSNNTLVAWGNNSVGQANAPVITTNVVSLVSGSGFSMALLGSGNVVSWGYHPNAAATMTNMSEIAAAYGWGLGLRTDGSICEINGDIPADLPLGRSIKAFYNKFMEITLDQKIVAWGYTRSPLLHVKYIDCLPVIRSTYNLARAVTGTSPLNPDMDDDGIPDGWEIQNGLDPLDPSDAHLDPDGDNVDNALEYLHHTDPWIADCDGDGLSDSVEIEAGTNPWKADTDDDGLTDPVEMAQGVNPLVADTDGDGLVDGNDGFISTNAYASLFPGQLWADANANGFVDGELSYGATPTNSDTDGDGLPDGWEVKYGFSPLLFSIDRTYAPDADPDGDGLTNLEELNAHTNPWSPDSDGDGMPDKWEVDHEFNPVLNDASADADGDGLSNLQEYLHGTNPRVADTDGDGVSDGAEVNTYHTNPLNPDTDGDGLSDGYEVAHGLDPLNSDSDGDGMTDGWEVAHGLNPLLNDAGNDPDGDGFTNLAEFLAGKNPQSASDFPESAPGLFNLYTPLEL